MTASPNGFEPKFLRPFPCHRAGPAETGTQPIWLDSPFLCEHYVCPAIAGGPSRGHWLLDLAVQFPVPPRGRWMVLGYNGGQELALLAREGAFAHLEAYETTAREVEKARSHVSASGIEDVEILGGSLEDLELPGGRYDVVATNMFLHRVAEVEGLVDRIHHGLKPGGWLLVNEYVGPSRFQFGDGRLRIVEELLAALPERLRFDPASHATKYSYIRHPTDFWDEIAPNEALSSERIATAATRGFRTVAQRPYGGTLLNPLLEGIIANFHPEREGDVALLRMSTYVEELLLREGVIESDFAVLIGQKL